MLTLLCRWHIIGGTLCLYFCWYYWLHFQWQVLWQVGAVWDRNIGSNVPVGKIVFAGTLRPDVLCPILLCYFALWIYAISGLLNWVVCPTYMSATMWVECLSLWILLRVEVITSGGLLWGLVEGDWGLARDGSGKVPRELKCEPYNLGILHPPCLLLYIASATEFYLCTVTTAVTLPFEFCYVTICCWYCYCTWLLLLVTVFSCYDCAMSGVHCCSCYDCCFLSREQCFVSYLLAVLNSAT